MVCCTICEGTNGEMSIRRADLNDVESLVQLMARLYAESKGISDSPDLRLTALEEV